MKLFATWNTTHTTVQWFMPGCKFKIIVRSRSLPHAVSGFPFYVSSPVYLFSLLRLH